ncbi:conserved phage C-terminal domain-containing protein [Lacticaseibacillus sp. 866-1]|uniref:conserved phage C-terminal domain-containing protein n=1 Tax=Lacticaseibacillus sp. 866-1 TaxID=2799576 RepID=UPI001941BD48|nr:conserved phage C-terminal domain-containing protein [Lacticaseibacillus sp. 866-1]
MDYFKQRRAYRKLLTEELSLSLGQNVLYRELLDYANDEGKIDEQFKLRNSVLASRTSLTEQGLSQARNRLVQEHLIEYTPGKKDKTAPAYKLVKLYKEFTKPLGNSLPASYKPVDQVVGSSVGQVVEHSTLLLPDKDKTKDKNHSPASAEPHVDFDKLFEYLNEKSGKHFKNTATNRKLVHERLREGFTPKDIQTAIDNVTAGWLGTDMEQYIRPSTIFRASKFEGYVNSVPRVAKPQQSGGKPQRQEATPEWMNPSYEAPKQEVTDDQKKELAEKLAALEELRKQKEKAE